MNQKMDSEIMLSHENTDLFLASLGMPASAFEIYPFMLTFTFRSHTDFQIGYIPIDAYEAQSGLLFQIENHGIERMFQSAKEAMLYIATNLCYQILTGIKYVGIENYEQIPTRFFVIGSGLRKKQTKGANNGSI